MTALLDSAGLLSTSIVAQLRSKHRHYNSVQRLFIYLFIYCLVKLTIVSKPDTREEIRSFPALAVTIVLCAPETAVCVTQQNNCVM